MNKQLKNIILILFALLLTCCGNTDETLNTKNDFHGAYIAVLGDAVSDEDFEKQFPNSSAKHFKSSSEFLLALSIGKCDAGLVERNVGGTLLEKRGDFASLQEQATASEQLDTQSGSTQITEQYQEEQTETDTAIEGDTHIEVEQRYGMNWLQKTLCYIGIAAIVLLLLWIAWRLLKRYLTII